MTCSAAAVHHHSSPPVFFNSVRRLASYCPPSFLHIAAEEMVEEFGDQVKGNHKVHGGAEIDLFDVKYYVIKY
ncbi:hypothetical protein CFC21_071744 [Triticum aestivum]|uniref:Uncharacterized protein n=2 Tax=Triticum aestivum TaxID=4565 RepID=A0A9R1HHV1_WHEAT|nr:hypothetical protein CFC21_071744 [Triticum aestivum]